MIIFVRCRGQIFIQRDGNELYCPNRSDSPCGSWCPFFEHRPKTPGYPESVVLKCHAHEITFCEGEEE
jgi:hypothetical protein